jgi:2-methylcitrate dehydratase PrpD
MFDVINERLSKFSSELRYEDIPQEVLDHLKRVLLDCYAAGCSDRRRRG